MFEAVVYPINPPDDSIQYHAETLDYIARVEAEGGGLTPVQKTAVDAFVRASYSGGWRDEVWRLNLFTGTNLASALVPLIFSTNYGTGPIANSFSNDAATSFVEGDYAENLGLSGDGSGKYLNTGLTNSFINDTNSMILVSLGAFDDTATASPIGARGAAFINGRYMITVPPTFYVAPTDNRYSSVSTNGISGSIFVGTSDPNEGRTYQNFTLVGTSNGATSAIASHPLLVFAVNENGAPGFYSQSTLRGYGTGVFMSSNLVVSMVAAISNFNAAVGR